MERLTSKHIVETTQNEKDLTTGQKKELKLGLLENLEQEIGVDLITLFKALRKSCIYDIEDKCYVFRNKLALITEFDDVEPQFALIGYCKRYYLKDYGKTWALTKKELE